MADQHEPRVSAEWSNTHERVFLVVRCRTCERIARNTTLMCPELQTMLRRLNGEKVE